MFNDQKAEHIPVCNMAFRREVLAALGGFDTQFRIAGDDVDVCWRIQERDWSIGFSPSALVWHHRRNSIRAYWRQQVGYGKAEALLERKWPCKYNLLGHAKWSGRIYGSGLTCLLGTTSRIYHGPWGTAPFQCLQTCPPSIWRLLPALPEWYLILAFLGAMSELAILWPRLRLAVPTFIVAIAITVLQTVASARRASFPSQPRGRWTRWKWQGLTALLHLLQPAARLYGRIRHGLTFWRWRLPRSFKEPFPRSVAVWSERWHAPDERLRWLKQTLGQLGAVASDGGDYDRWDMEVTGGVFGGVRLLMVVEEHGAGRQMLRFRLWPRSTPFVLLIQAGLIALVVAAYSDGARLPLVIFAFLAVFLACRMVLEWACAMAIVHRALQAPAP